MSAVSYHVRKEKIMSTFNKYRLALGVLFMIVGFLNYLTGAFEPTHGVFEDLIYSTIGTLLWFSGAYLIVVVLDN